MAKVSIYLAGPMRGYDQFNFPKFHEVTKILRDGGYDVWSPAEHDEGDGFDPTANSLEGFDLQAAMKWDLGCVVTVDMVVVLPGWRASVGTGIEVSTALAVGTPVYEWDDDRGTFSLLEEETILAEADRITNGARRDAYGHPFQEFTKIGRRWGALLDIPDIDPALVGLMMVDVKIIRETNRHSRDNLVDIVGYTNTVAMVEEARA